MISGLLPRSKSKQVKEEEKRRKEEEEQRKYDETVQMLLPWELEQQVAALLNPIKIPFVIAVGIFGCIVEAKIAAISDGAFSRGFGNGPLCMVHVAEYEQLHVKHPHLDKVAAHLDEFFAPAVLYVNETALSNKRCFIEENQTRCVFFNSSLINLTFDKDMCGVAYDPAEERCVTRDEFEGLSTHKSIPEEDRPGIEYRLPFFPYALLWMIFKLVFLPVHPIDRIAYVARGSPRPMPEPMFKLLTEPFWNVSRCPGPLATCLGLVLRPATMISKTIRFSLLPNSLILPLVTLRNVAKCPEYVIYTQDVMFSWVIYYWLILDLVSMFAGYIVGLTVCGGKAISTNWYRLYKCLSLPATIIALVLFIADFAVVFNFKFWQGLAIVLKIMFTLKLSFDFTLDVTQTLANTVILVDFLQLLIMIMGFLCPKLLAKVPIPSWIQQFVKRPEDTIADPDGGDDSDFVPPSSSTVQVSESEGLLTGRTGRPDVERRGFPSFAGAPGFTGSSSVASMASLHKGVKGATSLLRPPSVLRR